MLFCSKWTEANWGFQVVSWLGGWEEHLLPLTDESFRGQHSWVLSFAQNRNHVHRFTQRWVILLEHLLINLHWALQSPRREECWSQFLFCFVLIKTFPEQLVRSGSTFNSHNECLKCCSCTLQSRGVVGLCWGQWRKENWQSPSSQCWGQGSYLVCNNKKQA